MITHDNGAKKDMKPPVRFEHSTASIQEAMKKALVSANVVIKAKGKRSITRSLSKQDPATTPRRRMAERGPVEMLMASHAGNTTGEFEKLVKDWIATFAPKMSGEQFSPHSSISVAPKDYLDRMIAEPFTSFTFSPAGAAVYQLGPHGTAAKKLKEWDLKR